MENSTLSPSGLQLIVLRIAEEAWPLNLKYDGGDWFYFGQSLPLDIVMLMFEASMLRLSEQQIRFLCAYSSKQSFSRFNSQRNHLVGGA
jgi:hypothetical protein